MFSLPITWRDYPAVVFLGLSICGLLVLAILAASDFGPVPIRTARLVGNAVIETRLNPLGILGLAVSAIAVVAFVLAVISPSLQNLVRQVSAEASGDRIASASEAVGRELALVLAHCRTHLESNDTYTRTLTGARSELSRLSNAEQVRVVVGLLIAESERMRSTSADLQSKFEASIREIEALQVSLKGASKAALTDPLTGVGNRRLFDTAIGEAIQASSEKRAPLSLIMGDIDHFKRINDTFGHQIGDEIIKLFASVIASNVRKTHTVARYGGEEFGIILPNTDEAAATAIAESIRVRFGAKDIRLRNTESSVGEISASFGVAEYRAGEKVDDLVERADAKLYEAKTGGRNRVAAFGKT